MPSNIFVQQARVVTAQAKVRPSTIKQELALFDANGNPLSIVAATTTVRGTVKQAAVNADVATADGSDPATTQALANQLKISFNSLQAKLRTAGVLA